MRPVTIIALTCAIGTVSAGGRGRICTYTCHYTCGNGYANQYSQRCSSNDQSRITSYISECNSGTGPSQRSQSCRWFSVSHTRIDITHGCPGEMLPPPSPSPPPPYGTDNHPPPSPSPPPPSPRDNSVYRVTPIDFPPSRGTWLVAFVRFSTTVTHAGTCGRLLGCSYVDGYDSSTAHSQTYTQLLSQEVIERMVQYAFDGSWSTGA